MIKLQANCSVGEGRKSSVFAAFDGKNDSLIISKVVPITGAVAGCVFISDRGSDDRTMLFTDKNILEGAKCYSEMKGMGKLLFSDSAAMADPMNSIENDGMDERGRMWRIAPTISCSQMAVLALCIYAKKEYVKEHHSEMCDKLLEILTI